MPTYAYACTECRHHFDIVQSFTDDSLTTCPECSGALRKQYNAVGVVFKGGGFYKTDSRSGTGSSETAGSSNGSGGSESSSGAGDSSGSSAGSASTSSTAPSGASTSD